MKRTISRAGWTGHIIMPRCSLLLPAFPILPTAIILVGWCGSIGLADVPLARAKPATQQDFRTDAHDTRMLQTDTLRVPAVQLSTAHAALCRVGVGDEMPAPRLPDLDGKECDPTELIGAKATVVVLWLGNRPMTQTLLADLGPDVVGPYGKKGVAVIGVAIGQDATTTRKQLAAAEATYPVLLDPDGAAFALVGEKMLPRIYVLDAEGRIVWFDVEYSRATRRELRQTLQAMGE